MKIVELVLDDNEESGIEAISIVESPAIESDFVALKSDEIKLAEVDKEKKILMEISYKIYISHAQIRQSQSFQR